MALGTRRERKTGTECVNLTTFTFTYRLPGVFSWDTGRFVHAASSFEEDDIVIVLVSDPLGHLLYSAIGSATGTITGVGEGGN